MWKIKKDIDENVFSYDPGLKAMMLTLKPEDTDEDEDEDVNKDLKGGHMDLFLLRFKTSSFSRILIWANKLWNI